MITACLRAALAATSARRFRHFASMAGALALAALPAAPAMAQTIPTTTTLTSSPNPSTVGQSVTMTARIVAERQQGATGNVNFTDGATALGTVALTLADLGVAQVDGGGAHNCAIANDGTVWCWGSNSFGQLGNQTFVNNPYPEKVFGITNAVSVSAGGTHSCAVLSTGTVMCWGRNANGQLGNGSTTDSTIPVVVSGITNATQVTAGGSHTCALDSNQQRSCWGSNLSGQIGVFDNSPSQLTPVRSDGDWRYSSLSAGLNHTCGVQVGRTARCWGEGTYNQIGDGDNLQRGIPFQVNTGLNTPLTNVLSISAGGRHTCAVVDVEGTEFHALWCWGSNENGRLGRPTTGAFAQANAAFAVPALGSPSTTQLGNVYSAHPMCQQVCPTPA
jgi:alpha-tubulin suppressor-like RCC1 family protein